ncbi:hypothetical protein K432DRAFT_451917 [Lepidopterella palustris CBS 459.81]|uniref:G domain-containing protein n=1 Tax=Lepidopterella palustris CBS 459.81 TaxID=1314670 RepID=A0A8E2EB92_9PEZI|nr:hypothetical protein K432DRAFT_451917 [Lepidopterella palustris CBS 459.81]
MATSSTHRQGSIDQRTQECLSLIKNGNNQANVIILLGRTGAGKSSLLEDITGADGHSMDAKGDDITTEEIQIEFTMDERQYFTMDTPGFDMGKEVDTFYKIIRGIQNIRDHIRTWGILYVTKIDSRIETIDEKLLEFIRCFSGKDFVPNITFVTTHWNWHHEKEKMAKNNWLEKRKELWRSYLDNGAQCTTMVGWAAMVLTPKISFAGTTIGTQSLNVPRA